ncbi:MAG TPA: hypothetical protein VGH84_05675, partial [Steroidobacteraceae bacterium]
FTLPSANGKTFGTTAGTDMTQMTLWLSAGSSYAARAGSVGIQSGSVRLWGVQLEIGSVATPLEKPDPRYDLSNCQRFYSLADIYLVVYGPAGASIGGQATFPVQMRAVPTVAISNTTGSTNIGTPGTGALSVRAAYIYAAVSAAATSTLQALVTASADL